MSAYYDDAGVVMTYQDQKLRVIVRLAIFTLVLSGLLAITLIDPMRTESVVRNVPISRSGHNYIVLLGILLTLVPLCWAVLLGLIFTSPEQEVRFVNWTKRWRKHPIPFDAVEFDTTHPDYVKPAWRYFMDRRQR